MTTPDAHRLDPTTLREYDIRGVLGETLAPADARAIGRAFGTLVARGGGLRVAVGRDGRHSSPELEAALVEGLVACGLEVSRIGLGPTPMLYYAQRHLGLDAGIMVTGSHNPPDYNGFKMVLESGPVYGAMIQDIGRMAAGGDFIDGQGHAEEIDIRTAYVERLARDCPAEADLTIAWDAGNGAVGAVLGDLTACLPGRHIPLFDKVDGDFPNHHPDPTVEANLADLKRAVREQGCSFGVAFDGDGDRIGAVDERGRVVWGDQLLALYAREVLADQPGATVLADVKTSKVVFDEIARLGGNPMMWKTGHSLLKAKMKEIGAPLAGEMSGHIFFADRFYGHDDALYCAIRLMSLIAREGKSLGTMLDELPPSHATPETRFQVDEARKFEIPGEIVARLDGQEGIEVNTLDGIRVATEAGWWLLRASNTQDVLTARVEATSPEGLAALKGILCDQLEQSGIAPPAELRA